MNITDGSCSLNSRGKRDRAILAVFLFHGLRSAELAGLNVGDLAERSGVLHLTVRGKRSKTRYLPVAPAALRLIHDYLEAAGHAREPLTALFRPTQGDGTHLSGSTLHKRIVVPYAEKVGIDVAGVCVHSLRATAATNALENGADIAKVQEWLGHANISTTRLYDKRHTRVEDSPSYAVKY
jgi:integrase/recombinase XerD